MKKSRILKLALIFIVLIMLINIFNSDIYAMTSSYVGDTTQANSSGDANSMLSVITGLVLPVVYPLFQALAVATQKIMHSFTGNYFFPWADSIIFNRLAILDVNFINPAPGSLFMNSAGNYTTIGNIVRNVYFTILSICIGFLGVAVAINVIKMLASSMASSKARAKEMINATLLSLVLIFGMHYIISFVFYINEQLVQVASDMSESILNGETIKAATDNLYAAEDADNEQLVENFFDAANHTSLISPVVWIKKAFKEGANFVAWLAESFSDWLGNALASFKDWLTGSSDDEEKTMTSDEEKSYRKDIFPSKNDYIKYIKAESIDVAAYLIKDYIYRDVALSTVAGNDTNSFTQAGGWGLLQSAGNTVLWVTGIVDTGLLGLQNLYNTVCYIKYDLNDTVKKELGYGLTTASLCNKAIEYYTIQESAQTDDELIQVWHLKTLYVKAYYRYIYEGDDKEELEETTSVIQSLGEYFKRNVYYVDFDSGDWSSSTFDPIMCILYCVFILQSFMFLFSYIKRLFFVVILAMLGPVTVVFDYISKSY